MDYKVIRKFVATDSATLPVWTANQGGTSFLYNMDYTKQPLGYNQIIQQLRSRGLLFHDETTAEKELKNISYFFAS